MININFYLITGDMMKCEENALLRVTVYYVVDT